MCAFCSDLGIASSQTLVPWRVPECPSLSHSSGVVRDQERTRVFFAQVQVRDVNVACSPNTLQPSEQMGQIAATCPPPAGTQTR